MKTYMALMGAAIFFVVIMSMYLMLDQTKSFGEMSGPYDTRLKLQKFSHEDIDILQQKIGALENDLSSNQKTINQLRNAVKSLSNGIIPDLPNLVEEEETPKKEEVIVKKPEAIHEPVIVDSKDLKQDWKTMPAVTVAKAEIFTEECAFGAAPNGNTADVQMLDVYDSLRFDNPDGGVWKQGFDITTSPDQWKDDPLRVFLIPHSHNDPGWIKTVDKYFHDQTVHILDNMVIKLQEHSKMKFIWAEMSYLSMWWESTSQQNRDITKRLIDEGRLEIVTGGWVMNDEANTNYFAMIDQLIEGHEWLEAFLGVKPKSGWSIDPFGLTPTMAYLLQRMGFESMLIQRVHYAVKKYLAREKKLEFLWRQNWDHGSSTDMFCHMMPFYSYDVPHTCGPDPKICCQYDFKRLPGGRINCPWKIAPVPITDQNVAKKAEVLLDQYRKKSSLYKTNILLVPLGDDFRFDKPAEWDQQYTNYQKLFEYMNGHENWNVQAQFGTLSDYFGAVIEQTKGRIGNQPQGFPVLSGDFFTYTDREKDYWSGYYTSRPFYKNMDRVLESHLRAAEIIYTVAATKARQMGVGKKFDEDSLIRMVTLARRNLALFQHHDAITGTAKDHVVVDYGTKLLISVSDMRKVMMQSIHFLLSPDQTKYSPSSAYFDVDAEILKHDALPEKKVLKLSTEASSIAVFYNTLAHHRNELIRLHVSSPNVKVTDAENNLIPSQSNLIWMDGSQTASTKYELVFAVDIAPLGLKKYLIRDMGESQSPHHSLSSVVMYHVSGSGTEKRGPFVVEKVSLSPTSDFTIENSHIKATFSATTGLLKSTMTKSDGAVTATELQFLLYGTVSQKAKSGAYLFLPDGPAKPMTINKPLIRVVRGPLLSEVYAALPNVDHFVTIKGTTGVDSQSLNILNHVDIRNTRNQELIMRVKSDIQNPDRTFYTDLNGFQLQQRKTLDKLPIQANYYPMPSMAYLESSSTRMSLLTSHPSGVASLETGWIDVVLDRRLNQDDSRGLQQGVLDNKLTGLSYQLLIERNDGGATVKQVRNSPRSLWGWLKGDSKSTAQPAGFPSLLGHAASVSLEHPLYTHTALPESQETSSQLIPEFQVLDEQLPCDIHLLNLRTRIQQSNNAVEAKREAFLLLHRRGFDCRYPGLALSCSTNGGKVSSRNLFQNLNIRGLQATSLSGMYDGNEMEIDSDFTIETMEVNTYRVQFH
ncbi:alpha-mannosidase 2-like isoform X1 [Asterias rubens]|uniref:alpha-mannosidase 2-like isoform X1 n=1 Tax=Asterias rubens TaxID=7604 RepID=UPI001455C5AD|nr:alpha-mannosidase 2-like isoform X1 [Asterias rubens]XP_033625277.1 alpha-mannosidase 2-like isoform X1 [Asterias rubens]